MTAALERLIAHLKNWWHAISSGHRMSKVEHEGAVVWIGCGDCFRTFYGRPMWADLFKAYLERNKVDCHNKPVSHGEDA